MLAFQTRQVMQSAAREGEWAYSWGKHNCAGLQRVLETLLKKTFTLVVEPVPEKL